MAESASIQSGRLPHACLVSAASREDALREAKRLAAAAVCSGRGPRPCGACRDCRKALSGVHPDIILVGRLTDDKGKQKSEMSIAGGEPFNVNYPERFIEEFPPAVVLGYYEIPRLPEAPTVEVSFAIGTRSVPSGLSNLGEFKWKLDSADVPQALKLPPIRRTNNG